MEVTDIYKKIRETRISKGMTQEELAVKVGYKSGKTMISHIENGKKNLPLLKLKKIAEALDVTPSYLLGVEETNEVSKSTEDFIILQYAALNTEGRKMLISYLEYLRSQSEYTYDGGTKTTW